MPKEACDRLDDLKMEVLKGIDAGDGNTRTGLGEWMKAMTLSPPAAEQSELKSNDWSSGDAQSAAGMSTISIHNCSGRWLLEEGMPQFN